MRDNSFQKLLQTGKKLQISGKIEISHEEHVTRGQTFSVLTNGLGPIAYMYTIYRKSSFPQSEWPNRIRRHNTNPKFVENIVLCYISRYHAEGM